jgi:beta-galactosidase
MLRNELRAMQDEVPVEPACCAIVFDYESAWAWRIQPQAAGFSHVEIVLQQYRQLRKLGLNVDIVSPRMADFSAYKLVFLPALFAWNDRLRHALSTCSGSIVIGPRTGSKTENFHIPSTLPPDLPPEIMDLKVVRVDSLAPDLPIGVKGGGYVRLWLDKVESSAACLMETDDGWPVLLRQGKVHYLAALLDDEAARHLTEMMVGEAGLARHHLPPGVRLRWTGDHAYVFNYSPEAVDLRAAGLIGSFGLDGSVLPAAGVAVFTPQ